MFANMSVTRCFCVRELLFSEYPRGGTIATLPEDRRATQNLGFFFFFSLQSVIFLPNAFGTDFNIPSPAVSPPPAYDNVAYMPKESSE